MKKQLKIVSVLLVLFLFFLLAVGSSDSSETPEESTTITYEEDETFDYKAYEESFVLFGKYEQDNNIENGTEDIEWCVIATDGEYSLLFSRYILDYQAFNDTVVAEATGWENSSLRSWLNNDFYSSAFSDQEQSNIKNSEVQDFKADNELGGTTYDNVFILNLDQLDKYVKDDYYRGTYATDYARNTQEYSASTYWLINSYSSDLYKYAINSSGENENNPRVNEDEGVRPAIWVKTDCIKIQ